VRQVEIVRRHLWVSGRVQGVFFRQACADVARNAGVAGWVRNLPDGRVEAVFEGEPAVVQVMVDWCSQGPPSAHVQSVEIADEPLHGDGAFLIRGAKQ